MMSLSQVSTDPTEELSDTSFEQSYINESHFQSESEPSFDGESSVETDPSSPVKRRKIDKDGFVCPATPDIPITSHHYGQSRLHRQEKPENENDYDQEPYESEDVQVPLDQEAEENVVDQKDRTGMSVGEVVQDLGQESKMLYNQWSNMFSESENFENFCPVRLDKMIEQAKQLEESLIKQKQLLCTRLNVISHIIRTSISEGPGGDHS